MSTHEEMRDSTVATVTSDGTLTIPEELRAEAGLDGGTEVEIQVEDDGSLTVRERRSGPERLRRLRESLPEHDVDTDELRRRSKGAWSSQTTEGTE